MRSDLDDVGGAKELALHRLAIAREDLEAAEISFESGHYRSSNNRAYYAIFRAISACLALQFKAYKQHSQMIGNFNKDFVHAGVFPKEISRRISRAQEVRHSSDYDELAKKPPAGGFFYLEKREGLFVKQGKAITAPQTVIKMERLTYDKRPARVLASIT